MTLSLHLSNDPDDSLFAESIAKIRQAWAKLGQGHFKLELNWDALQIRFAALHC